MNMNCHSQQMKESYSSAHDRITSTSPFSNKQNLKKQTKKKTVQKYVKCLFQTLEKRKQRTVILEKVN